MPEVPTPINTVTNIENRLAANTVKAMAISSCGFVRHKIRRNYRNQHATRRSLHNHLRATAQCTVAQCKKAD